MRERTGTTCCSARPKGSAVTETRQQLVAMRGRLLDDLGSRIDGGNLSLLTAIGGALAAIDAESGEPADAEPMARAIVTDAPGLPIGLALYAADGKAAAVELLPLRALALANQLLAAALARLR